MGTMLKRSEEMVDKQVREKYTLEYKLESLRQVKATILNWMASYNYACLHSTLGYLSPMQSEQRLLAAQCKNTA